MNECLNGRFVEMTNVGCRLAWFLAKHSGLWVDGAEGIDNDFSFDRLNRINDDGYCTCI